MNKVLIIGASGGIGRALGAAHRGRGDSVVELSRSEHGLDIRDEASVAAHLSALDGGFDRIIVATGALEIDGAGPEKTIKAIRADAMAQQFAVNAIGPALVLAQAGRLLAKGRPACFAVLSARVGSISDNHLGGWISYRAAKAALNQIVRTSAIEVARSHPQACVVSLHPGTVASAFTAKYLGRHPSVDPSAAADNLAAVMDRLRPQDTGGFFDYTGATVEW
jgi:NAD(P)-dependent dehydrogenase (short-subunit alcohol dehydrogenase family)